MFVDLTERDYERSQTSRMLSYLDDALSLLEGKVDPGPLLDIGCGHGGLVLHVGARLGIDDVHGIDFDPEAVSGSVARGVKAQEWNLRTTPLPFPDSTFSVITSFGVLDYLPTYDRVLEEIARILRPGGFVVISLPNLSSWHNRWALLRGYQPRDLEISTQIVVGVHPHYGSPPPVGHISAVTARGFRELMEYVGFETVALSGASPMHRIGRFSPARIVDWFCRRSATLASRFIYVGHRPVRNVRTAGSRPRSTGWWQRVAAEHQ